MIRVLVVPADYREPHRQLEMNPTDLRGFQALVGGFIERLELAGGASLYVNEDGIAQVLRFNERATALAAFHSRPFTPKQAIVGDAYLTGPADQHGLDTDVPEQIVHLLGAPQIQVQVRSAGESRWEDIPGTYPTLVRAYTDTYTVTNILTVVAPAHRPAIRAIPVTAPSRRPDTDAVWTVWGDRVDPYAVRQTREQAQAVVDTATAEGDTGVYAQHPDGTTLTATPTR
ncbi:DUF3846 domain-containing protein [Frankia sp. KB5]|uniref:DUF3846 domain-containing protein n=1 Tax=Frankia sp. KB5 TaxID=683318 RepID=UPI000A11C03D|nr:DUF3846 domain-containing protein [Frankia sp. KB5]ORT46584.1 hypothetical protein KBI5_24425 [Frankia sp. KB5]